MFSLLKGSSDEPDAERAAEVGLEEGGNEADSIANPVARDMLLRMPGVALSNVQKLMETGGSLAGIADLEVKELQKAMGPQSGKALHEFLHAPYPAS
jgi:ERCC4-type nuclease